MSSLQMSTLDEMRQTAATICRDYLTGEWKVVRPEELIVKRISGGFSNYLYYVSLPDNAEAPQQNNSIAVVSHANLTSAHKNCYRPSSASGSCSDDEPLVQKRQRTDSNSESQSMRGMPLLQQYNAEPREVLIRIYGQTHGEDALESMITESVVFALLSERNLGPKLHGIFPGGRIEQFIQARPLKTSELADPKISLKVAEKMAEIHSLNIPMSKEPDWAWNCMRRWLNSLSNIINKSNWGKNEPQAQRMRSIDLAAEVKWLKDLIDQDSYPVVFCHNDFQEGNILIHEDTNEMMNCEIEDGDDNDPELIVIDFEYCAYNYRGFDLANHFIEWTLPYNNPDYPHYYLQRHAYPTSQQRLNFISTYLRRLNESTVPDYEPSAEEIEGVEHEIAIFSMLSHLFWTLWSLVNVTSNIEFGYWEYAVTRMDEYLRLKENICNNNNNNNNNIDNYQQENDIIMDAH